MTPDLEGGPDPERVAGIDGLVGPSLEAIDLATDAPADESLSVPPVKGSTQVAHQLQ